MSETLKPQEVLLAKRLHPAAPRCEHMYLNVMLAGNLIVTSNLFAFLFSPAFFFSPRLMSVTFSTFCIPENEAAVFSYIHYGILKSRPRGPRSGGCVCAQV